MITLGFTLLGRGIWTSGLGYLRLTASSVRHHVPDRLRIRIVVSPDEYESQKKDLTASFSPDEIVIDPRIEGAGRGRRLIEALATGKDRLAEDAFIAAGCDCVFENAIYLGLRFRLPVMAWFPDFQHRAMPHLFSKQGWWRRDIGFRLQAATRPVIVLSSEAARHDCERYFRSTVGKTAVVKFAAPVDVDATFARSRAARDRFDIPDDYFFLPNQFFAHKNHDVVIEALLRAKISGRLPELLPIILTGRPVDPRDPEHFARLEDKLIAADVGKSFQHLGLVDYADVLAMASTAQALINPSLFEGWSTPIEEAKALGVPLILSDLPVLREQAPNATFFDPHDADALLLHLIAASKASPRPSQDHERLKADQESRSRAHAVSLLQAAQMTQTTA